MTNPQLKFYLTTLDIYREALEDAPPEQRADPDWWLLVSWKIGEALDYYRTRSSNRPTVVLFQQAVDKLMAQVHPHEFLLTLKSLYKAVRYRELPSVIAFEESEEAIQDEILGEWVTQHRQRLSFLAYYFDTLAGAEVPTFGPEIAQQAQEMLQTLTDFLKPGASTSLNGCW